jgi:hypothetical protein
MSLSSYVFMSMISLQNLFNMKCVVILYVFVRKIQCEEVDEGVVF